MKALTIGAVARRAGVGVETFRFYEREGLIPQPPRRPSGSRQYDAEAVRRIRFIRHAKQLGFSLRQIRELLTLRAHPQTSCAEGKERAEAKIAEVEQKICDLQAIQQALVELSASCAGRGPDQCQPNPGGPGGQHDQTMGTDLMTHRPTAYP